MASSPVNIAEFRSQPQPFRVSRRTSWAEAERRGLEVVPANPEPAREEESLNPQGVYDFAAARERVQARTHAAYDPMPLRRRRGNVVRLNEPHVAVLCVTRHEPEMVIAAGEDRDLPPAA